MSCLPPLSICVLSYFVINLWPSSSFLGFCKVRCEIMFMLICSNIIAFHLNLLIFIGFYWNNIFLRLNCYQPIIEVFKFFFGFLLLLFFISNFSCCCCLFRISVAVVVYSGIDCLLFFISIVVDDFGFILLLLFIS